MRLAYISGPYRAKTLRGVIDNIRKAEAIALELWQMGYAAICPHLNTRLFPEGAGELEEGGEIDYIAGDLEILNRFYPGKDIIVMMSGWNKSEGARLELQRAIERGLKVSFWPQDRKVLESLAKIESEQGERNSGDTPCRIDNLDAPKGILYRE